MEMRGVAPRPLPFFYICTLNSTLIHPICHKNFRALSRAGRSPFSSLFAQRLSPVRLPIKKSQVKRPEIFMEMRGVEPLSARATTAVSTSVVCAFTISTYPALTEASSIQSQQDKLPCLAILRLQQAILQVDSLTPTSQNTWAERSLIKQRQLIYYC